MRRRNLVKLAAGVAAGWPLGALAQHRAVPVIGFLGGSTFEDYNGPSSRHALDGFRRGLAQVGYVEGRNVAIEYRWAEGHSNRLPALAAELVRRQVAVIVTAGSSQAARAAKAATQTIPIVFVVGNDPVELGLVTNLARPAGNLTGVMLLSSGLIAKRLELLHELVPSAKSIAFLHNSSGAGSASGLVKAQVAAESLGIQLIALRAGSRSDIENGFASLVEKQAGALLVGPGRFLSNQSDLVVELSARHAIPASYPSRVFVDAGGLSSYGASVGFALSQTGAYVGRISRANILAISRWWSLLSSIL